MNDQILMCSKGAAAEGTRCFDKDWPCSAGAAAAVLRTPADSPIAAAKQGMSLNAVYWRRLGHYNLLAQTLLRKVERSPRVQSSVQRAAGALGAALRWLQHVCSPEVEQTVFLIPCT